MNGVFGELLSDKTKYYSWYGDSAVSVYSTRPWFVLGGYHTSGSYADAFGSNNNIGNASGNYGFRVALS